MWRNVSVLVKGVGRLMREELKESGVRGRGRKTGNESKKTRQNGAEL